MEGRYTYVCGEKVVLLGNSVREGYAEDGKCYCGDMKSDSSSACYPIVSMKKCEDSAAIIVKSFQ